MDFQFQRRSKFALVAVENVYADVPRSGVRLSDNTHLLPAIPVQDLGIWKDWIGSIAVQRLNRANLVLVSQEESDKPEIVDHVHQRLAGALERLFSLLQLSGVPEYEGAESLVGSSIDGQPQIRQMGELRIFYPSRGYTRAPLTVDRLERAICLSAGLAAVENKGSDFARLIRGLNTLMDGLAHRFGQDRLHQFVRSLEALILPDVGQTKKQFTHRCRAFAVSNETTQTSLAAALAEAFDMRSDTEHVHDWQRSLQRYREEDREAIACQRTRQMERLATFGYSRVLSETAVREHFRNETVQAQFWKLDDVAREAIWGEQVDISGEPLVRRYHEHTGRAIGAVPVP